MADVFGARAGVHPTRDVAGHAFDVGREQRVVHLVRRRVIADDVDDRRTRPPGVVQVREPVPEAGAEVQQRGPGPVGHSGIPVGGTGRHTLEQRQQRSHLRYVVERGHEVHLRCAGVREAVVDTGGDERAQQRMSTVHCFSSVLSVLRSHSVPARLHPDTHDAAVRLSPGACRGSRCRSGRTPP